MILIFYRALKHRVTKAGCCYYCKNFDFFMFRVQTTLKPGKVKLFYSLNTEFDAVALVGLPMVGTTVNELENLDEFKEGIRIAASGNNGSLSQSTKTVAVTPYFRRKI